MTVMLELTAGVATDVGRVRDHNEDAAVASESVFAVADGMGGHAAGEVASEIAARTVGRLDGMARLRLQDIVAQVDEANRTILRSAANDPRQAGMGTTLAGLAVIEVSGRRRRPARRGRGHRGQRQRPLGRLQHRGLPRLPALTGR